VCYERGWEARKRNDEATSQIRRLFARYRAEAQRARDFDYDKPPVSPVWPVLVRDREPEDEREPVLH
jgi:hypothetical protein